MKQLKIQLIGQQEGKWDHENLHKNIKFYQSNRLGKPCTIQVCHITAYAITLMSKDVVSRAMIMKIKNTRVVGRVQEIQLVHYGRDKGTIKMKYHRRKKCKCEQYNHNAWSQDLTKNMGLGETNMYIPWQVMCKLMINEHKNICVHVYCNDVNVPG